MASSRAVPEAWKHIQSPYRDIIDAYDAKIKMTENPSNLQAEMDSLNAEYVKLSKTSIVEQYAFVPANPTAISYLTANFLHGGWLHIIGNMWFLWLAGFVLEDVWGRWLYSAFYLIAGAAALQFYAWSNPGSITPTLGASGAVAALMGAFLVRFPKMKIEMAWLFLFKLYRFKAAAYWLLPIWLFVEIFYGSLVGSSGGVAHWAHVGGFLFGALAALAIQYSGIEQKTNKAVEEKISWTTDPEIEKANDMMEHGQLPEAITLLTGMVAAKPNSLDGWNLLRQIYYRQNNTKAYLEATHQNLRPAPESARSRSRIPGLRRIRRRRRRQDARRHLARTLQRRRRETGLRTRLHRISAPRPVVSDRAAGADRATQRRPPLPETPQPSQGRTRPLSGRRSLSDSASRLGAAHPVGHQRSEGCPVLRKSAAAAAVHRSRTAAITASRKVFRRQTAIAQGNASIRISPRPSRPFFANFAVKSFDFGRIARWVYAVKVRQSRLVSSEIMPSTPNSANRCMSAASFTVQTMIFFPAPFTLRTNSASTSS